MKTLKLSLFLIFILIPLAGCGNVLYLSKLGWHQAYITFHSVPVQEVLEDEGMSDEIKEKIKFIQEVKRYGEEKLGLRKTKSYSKFFEVKGPILYVVTASEKDRLQIHQWSFPIVGKVTYKGFFTKEEALHEQNFLEKKDLDTFVHGVGAYSTLGWLKDPIFSSILKWNDVTLANLILHEMTHAAVYFKGETDLNEQIATFVGNQGAIHFLVEKFGVGSKKVIEAVHLQEDDLVFSNWIDQACQRLSNFYAEKISREEKLRGRIGVFESVKEELKRIQAQFKTDQYKGFEKVDLNNAVLLAYRRYLHRLKKFEILYEHLGRDLKRVVEYFKMIQTSGDMAALASFLE